LGGEGGGAMLCAGIKAGTPLVRVYSDLKQESHKPEARFHASLRKVFPSVVANLRSPLIAPGPKHLLFQFASILCAPF